MRTKILSLFAAVVFMGGCATVHRATISEIRSDGQTINSLDVKASETGFDVQGASRLTRNLTRRHGNSNAKAAGKYLDIIVQLSSMSPQTGNPTTSETWSDGLSEELRRQCVNGRVTNLMVVRESANYPLVSGEIVRVRAACVR